MEKQIGWGLGITIGLSTAILFNIVIGFLRKDSLPKHSSIRTLLDVGAMFLPAIPAYIWVWPNLQGTSLDVFQKIVYLYILTGTILIGIRHYNWNQLGVNRHGIGLGLVYGSLLIIGRSLVILAVDWKAPIPDWNTLRVFGDLAYCIIIGVTEELLFRGLLYRVLIDWHGLRWAIWGTSIGFVFWHIFGQGPLIGTAMMLYGLLFALMRWRLGGITALIITHTLVDFFAFQMLPTTNVADLGRMEVPHPFWMMTGLILIVAVPLFLWLGHGKIFKSKTRSFD